MSTGAQIKSKPRRWLIACAVSLLPWFAMAATATVVVTPDAGSAAFGQLQLRLDKLKATGLPASNYSLGKAQCWLNTARSQDDENDRSGYVQEALDESTRIVAALEAQPKSSPGFETPLIARSTRLRDDLWAQLALLKSQPETLACTGREVACAEVRLVRAGHANVQTGWRQANPHVEMAQDGLRRARADAAACANPAPVPVATATAVVIQPQPLVAQPPVRIDFAADALFKFGESSRAALLPGGVKAIERLAETLKRYQRIEAIKVVGHTDRLGSASSNEKLSYERAATVLTLLESRGIRSQQASVSGVGESQPLSHCSDKLARGALIQCLQPDRRVSIEISGTP